MAEPPVMSKEVVLPTSGSKEVEVPSGSKEQTNQSKEKTEQEPERERFSSNMAYIMAAVGFSVGLGNIWRFPGLAFKNGGFAFLIPYLMCTFGVGMSLMYLETFMTQFVQKGPGRAYYMYMPVAQGIGFTQAILVFLLSAYYYIVIGWATCYVVDVLAGNYYTWNRCDNDWNSDFCTSTVQDDDCFEANETLPFYFNKTCTTTEEVHHAGINSTIVAAEEYFDKMVLRRSGGIDELEFNYKLFLIMIFLWIMCGLVNWKGVHILGKIAYFTTSIPYVIVVIFFIRGVTLPGASKGIEYFLFRPDFTKLVNAQTWSEALSQTFVSLSLGYGGMSTVGSFNRPNHNTLRDAMVIVVADTVMSVVGGSAVFSAIGYLSYKTEQPIEKVVQGGPTLVFVTSVSATSTMAAAWLWSLLFFIMVIFLGFSTIIVNCRHISMVIVDSVPPLRPHYNKISLGVVISLFLFDLIMCTRAGVYWLTLFDAVVSSFIVYILIFLELLVAVHFYGPMNIRRDLHTLFGKPTTKLGHIFGQGGYLYLFVWLAVIPFATVVITGIYFANGGPSLSYAIPGSTDAYIFPQWATNLMWTIIVIALLIPILTGAAQVYKHYSETGSIKAAFRPHPSHPTYTIGDPKTLHDIGLDSKQPEEPSISPPDVPTDTPTPAPAQGPTSGSAEVTPSPSA